MPAVQASGAARHTHAPAQRHDAHHQKGKADLQPADGLAQQGGGSSQRHERLQQLQLATTAKDFNDLTARQIELNTQFAEKATQRSQDLVKLSTEHQAEMTKWFDTTVAETAKTAKKAA